VTASTLPVLRDATVADIVNRLRDSTYLTTDVIALGWGMGDAQNNITAAVIRAVRMGLLTTGGSRNEYVELTPYGRDWTPEPVFTLAYRTSNGRSERVLTSAGVERVGRVVMRLAGHDMATDIEIRDEAGREVTFDFACFA
jgi:hypothetical protein